MQHSSRKTPCPICLRNTDDKCRWSETRIFCYNGESFSPPQSLRLGDKVKVHGIEWKLFSLTGGLSGNSYAFFVARDNEYRFLSYQDKRAFRKKCINATRLLIKKKEQVRNIVSALAKGDDFQSLTLEQFNVNKQSADEALIMLKDLNDYLFSNRAFLISASRDIKETKAIVSEVKDLSNDIACFEQLCFGWQRPARY